MENLVSFIAPPTLVPDLATGLFWSKSQTPSINILTFTFKGTFKNHNPQYYCHIIGHNLIINMNSSHSCWLPLQLPFNNLIPSVWNFPLSPLSHLPTSSKYNLWHSEFLFMTTIMMNLSSPVALRCAKYRQRWHMESSLEHLLLTLR